MRKRIGSHSRYHRRTLFPRRPPRRQPGRRPPQQPPSSNRSGVRLLLLRRLRIDPAVVSAPLITTLVDGTGLFIYFTVAQVMLGLD